MVPSIRVPARSQEWRAFLREKGKEGAVWLCLKGRRQRARIKTRVGAPLTTAGAACACSVERQMSPLPMSARPNTRRRRNPWREPRRNTTAAAAVVATRLYSCRRGREGKVAGVTKYEYLYAI
ncbi:hypothetical protein MRX96_046493 [Rhipicephalus microplus]